MSEKLVPSSMDELAEALAARTLERMVMAEARAEAAEARCARLAGELMGIAEVCRDAQRRWRGVGFEPGEAISLARETADKARAALSDTAQQEKVCERCGELCGRVHPGLALCCRPLESDQEATDG